MEIEKLCKEDFTSDRVVNGTPSVRFSRCGAICLNKSAVNHLKLFDHKTKILSGVSFFQDVNNRADFSICKDTKGWVLRHVGERSGCVIFNNAIFARYIIKMTWDEKISHAVDKAIPDSLKFRIALLSLDDDKNKDVYALLRKKE